MFQGFNSENSLNFEYFDFENVNTIYEIITNYKCSTIYSNLIELAFLENDAMVTPKMLKIGRQVHIIHDGVEYVSLLSGKEMNGGKITLTFGTIRLELTSFLKGRY
jgi:hypothetical protein